MKSLSFAFHLRSASINALRKQLVDEGLDVRDTKLNVVSRSGLQSATGPIEPLMVTAAKLSLLSSCCFALGGSLPSALINLARNLESDDYRVQALVRFEPNSTTPEDLVNEFKTFVHDQHLALRGLAGIRQRVVFKAIVTPTRILFERPELAPSNRVFREFDSEQFMYVYFRDESRERADFSDDAIAERVRRVLKDGIQVGRSHFRFLGCSLSQLRNAHCIFTLLNPASVRQWMGDLHHITSPPKYLKRLGQSFSSTREAFKVHPDVLANPADDIKDDSGRFEFTDGCGEITLRAAQSVASKLNLFPIPSAFQIRLGGAKGVLVVSNFDVGTSKAATSPLVGECGVRLRKSMVKFASPHHMLEIVAHASPHSLASLTRQSIVILRELGISDSVFLDLQDEFMESLAKMVVSDRLGLQELRASVPPDQIQGLDLLYGETNFDQAKLDLYHRRIIHAIYQYRLNNTVMRARIPVTKGRILMGVADFFGTLNYGEVFVQYSERDPSGASDLTRVVILDDVDVLIHRSPCHHPGDIRVLRCRGGDTVPQALRQLHDCVVFPTRGSRPHPDECTGGDLDGDVFTVIWDERLVPQRANVAPAMTLTEGLDAFANNDVPASSINDDRLVEFCLFALKHDILGPASNAHLAVSDDESNGCFAIPALVLAEICAREVDCCKNPKHMEVVQKLSPHQYPDFMRNHERPSYKSRKVLGKMYRRALALLTRTAPNFSGSCGGDIDESFLTDGYLKYMHVAAVMYQQYKSTIRMMVQSCGAVSEAELATGMIIEPASEYRAEYFRFGERSRDAFYRSQRLFRDEFERAYGEKSEHTRRRVAAAWYAVAYADKSDDRVVSFPWILSDLLITNKKIRQQELSQGWLDAEWLDIESGLDPVELVACKLQLNILSELEESCGGLLAGYQERLQAMAELRIAIQPNFDDIDAVSCELFGSSAMLTFEPQSDLDVVISGVESLSQLKQLAQFVESVKSIANVKLRERTYVPVLSLSMDEVWSIEISSSRNGPKKTRWFRAYMAKYPFFWPAAFFLVKWGKAAGLIRRRCLDGSNRGSSMFLPVGFLWLFLEFCLERQFVQPIEYPEDTHEQVDIASEISFWTHLLQRSQDPSTYPTAANVILGFFRFYGSVSTPQKAYGFVDPLDSHNDTELTALNVDIFRELCYVDHHQLMVSSGDLESLLRQQHDHRRRITLSRALSKHVHRSPEFFAAKILLESGARSRDVSLSFSRHPNALRPDLYVADVTGDGDSVHLIEQKIEKIEEELGSPQTHRQTRGVHRSGCSLLLFEGASLQTEKVGFQQYFAPRHAQHESFELHQAHLVCCPSGRAWLEHAIAVFTTKFIRQMVRLAHFEKLNPGVASCKAIVRFGHHYLIHLPWSFHEESISLATIEMLEQEFERGRETRELYESVLVARKEAKREAARQKVPSETAKPWEELVQGGGGTNDSGSSEDHGSHRPKRTPLPLLQKATAMTTRDHGVAHSFYSMIPPDLVSHLKDFVSKHKRMRVTRQTESYQVSIIRDSFDFNVRLSATLQLAKVKTRANRWLSATLKMRQELVDDQSRMDSTPDVRFYVTANEDVPSSDELPQLLERACAQAPGGRGVLDFLPSAPEGPPLVRISDELLAEGVQVQDIVNVRHAHSTTYDKDSLSLRVLTVHEFTLPSSEPRAGFLRVTPKTEVEIVMPPLTPDARVDADFARRFLLAGVELVEFLRERARDEVGDDEDQE